MAKVSLKVNIAGRTYPLTVNDVEEQRVLKAAEEINKAIKLLQDTYAVKDMQDLLAMSALQLNSRSAASQTPVVAPADFSQIESSLQQLSDDLDELS